MTQAAAMLPEVKDLEIRIVDNEADLTALRIEWTELLASSNSDCLFLTWEWVHTWWKHFGVPRRLFIVTIRSGAELIGIAPLTVTRTWLGPVSVPVLEFAGTGIVGSDYLDLIIQRGRERDVISAFATYFSEIGTSMRLPRVSEKSAAAMLLCGTLDVRGWRCIQEPTEVCPYIDFFGMSWEQYLKTLGSSHRYNFNRRLRNLTKNHHVRIASAESDEQRRAFLAHVVDLHLLRWEPRGGSDAFNSPAVLAFHEDFSRLAFQRGWLRLSLLELDGKPAAAFYCFKYADTFYFYQSGFDPAHTRSSVGLVMMGLSIQGAITEGAKRYDLLHGTESYKFLWARQIRQLVRLELYPPGRLGRMHRNAARATAVTKRFARRLLGADGVTSSPEITS